jgi:uncharacterized protein YodC (DUF2158 family)
VSFEAGELVRLKSGGPLMTVEQVAKRDMTDREEVWCVWFEKVGNKQVVQRDTFVPALLEKAKKPSVGAVMVV